MKIFGLFEIRRIPIAEETQVAEDMPKEKVIKRPVEPALPLAPYDGSNSLLTTITKKNFTPTVLPPNPEDAANEEEKKILENAIPADQIEATLRSATETTSNPLPEVQQPRKVAVNAATPTRTTQSKHKDRVSILTSTQETVETFEAVRGMKLEHIPSGKMVVVTKPDIRVSKNGHLVHQVMMGNKKYEVSESKLRPWRK